MVEAEILGKNSNISPNNMVVVISTLKDSRIMALHHNNHSNRNMEEEVETSIMKVLSPTIMEEDTINLLGMEVKNQHIMVEVEIGRAEVVLVEEVEEVMVEEVGLRKNLGRRNSEEIVAEVITEVGMEVAKIKTVFNLIYRMVSKSKV
jgi:hypothetical protein